MANRLSMMALLGAGSVLLSGCEIVLPILALISGNNSSDPYSDPYYDDDGYYDDYGYYGNIDVEVDDLSGTFYGRPIEMAPSAPQITGTQSGSSAYFALTVAEDGEDPVEYLDPDAGTGGELDAGAPRGEPGGDLTVTLDICPIEDYANGLAIPEPDGVSSYLNFYVCDQSYNCLDSYSGDIDIEVEDDASGVRRVRATGTWGGGDRVTVALHYTRPD